MFNYLRQFPPGPSNLTFSCNVLLTLFQLHFRITQITMRVWRMVDVLSTVREIQLLSQQAGSLLGSHTWVMEPQKQEGIRALPLSPLQNLLAAPPPMCHRSWGDQLRYHYLLLSFNCHLLERRSVEQSVFSYLEIQYHDCNYQTIDLQTKTLTTCNIQTLCCLLIPLILTVYYLNNWKWSELVSFLVPFSG